MTTEDRWFGQLLRAVACLDREVKDCDIDDFVQNSLPEVTTKLAERMNAQVYNVLTLWTKDNPNQTVARMWLTKKMSAAWVKLLRSYNGKHANRSQQRNVSATSSGSFRVEMCCLGWGIGELGGFAETTRKRHR